MTHNADQQRRELFARRLHQQGINTGPTTILPLSQEHPAPPLSFAQQRLWFLHQLWPDESAYNTCHAVRLHGPLVVSMLAASFNSLIRRHQILRTTFQTLDGEPVQVIAAHGALPLALVDLRHLPAVERQQQFDRLTRAELRRPFDLCQGPLIRATMYRLADVEHVLILTIHHIIFDGWSIGILIRELGTCYAASIAGRRPVLPDLRIHYADFAIWQRAWLQGAVLEQQLTYWKRQLDMAPAMLALATDRVRPATQTLHGARQYFDVSPAVTAALKQVSEQEAATLFMILLAAFNVLLYRYSGQDDLLVGTPIANRNRVATEALIGFFVNTLVIRTGVTGRATFREVLRQVRAATLDAYTHQDLPFELLVEKLRPERDPSRTPLFQTMFALQNSPMPPLELAGLTLEVAECYTETAKFDLTLMMSEADRGLRGWIEYNTDLFDADSVARMIDHFLTLVAGIAARPDQRVRHLPLLTDDDRQRMLIAWNDTRSSDPLYLVQTWFEAQAERTPDAIAVVFDRPPTTDHRPPTTDQETRRQGDKETQTTEYATDNGQRTTDNGRPTPAHPLGPHCLTYSELNRRANQLAHYLRQRGVGPEVVVGLCVERSMAMVIGLLGILKAGGAYVPLDPAYPQKRLWFMLEDSRAPVLLTATTDERRPTNDDRPTTTDQRQGDKQTRGQAEGQSETQHSTLNTQNFSEQVVDLVADWQAIGQEPATNPESGVCGDDLAYVIYTSGSTGTPKGIAITQQNAAAFISWARRIFNPDQLQGVLASTSICFDLSIFELFVTLSSGGTVILAENVLQLLQLPAAQRVTLINSVPSAMAALLRLGDLPASVRTVNLAGEPLPPQLARQLYQHPAIQQVYNLYGPSETTTYSTYALISRDVDGLPPIGRPIANTQVYVLDEQRCPVPIGAAGEIYIGGAGIARGYLNRPALTAERFIPNPFADERPTTNDQRPTTDHRPPTTDKETRGQGDKETANPKFNTQHSTLNTQNPRLYRTGDLARYRADGSIEYLGRLDQQVKVRGFRIELGEIETALNLHAAIQEAVVVVREDTPGEKRLIAYIVPTNDQRPTTNDKETRGQGDKEALLSPSAYRLAPDSLETQHSTLNTQNFSEQSTIYNLQSAIPETLSSIFYPLFSELRAFLKEQLPEYMLPSAFVFLAQLPLTPSGKLDRAALPAPDRARPLPQATFVAPNTPLEQQLAAIWAAALGRDHVGVHDSFFDLGGHSLLLVRVQQQLETVLRLTVLVVDLFKYPTIHALAGYLEQLRQGPADGAAAAQARADLDARAQTRQQGLAQQRQRRRAD